MIRSILCAMTPAEDVPEDARLGDGEKQNDPRELAPWLSRWRIDENRTIHVRALTPDGETIKIIDARYWLETAHDEEMWPDGTTFEVIIEVT